MSKIRIRRLYANDLNNVLDLFTENLNIAHDQIQKFKKRLLFSYIISKPLILLGLDIFIGSVAQAEDGKIAGTIITRRFPLAKSWVLGPVAVQTNFRRLGIATCMINSTLRYLRDKKARWAILSVERSNTKARRFFEKCGFRYLKPIFSNHDKARNYVRMLALIFGYLENLPYKIEQHPSQRRNADLLKPEIKKIRKWYIMLKEF